LDVLRAIGERRSIRSFLDKDITESDIRKIVECGALAPSAGNLQPWEFVVVRDPGRRGALAEAAHGQDFIAEAPVVIVVLANQARSATVYGRRGSELYSIQDTAAAIQNMLLAAWDMGLGSCWVGAFDEGAVAEIVGAGPRI
jgi:nitroreductase